MRHGSLFSGIGGFDLAAEWMGWENVFHCEWNPFGQKILKHYWPLAKSYDDIKKSDFTEWRGIIDVVSGGFPCQPYSLAGKRKGKEDDRHLWPEMLRAIREIQPSWVVGENVFGLVNWSGGLVFHEVQTDLETEGYEVWPYVLPACAKNAPHRRDRVWFVAHNNRFIRGTGWDVKSAEQSRHRESILSDAPKRVATNTTGARPQTGSESESRIIRQMGKKRNSVGNWSCFPTQSPICGGNDGLPTGLDGITFSKWRNESIKSYGNAVVPQVVYEIFKSIESYEKNIHPGLPQPQS